MNELKKAYQLVTQDLFNRLLKAKNNERIIIGTLGALGSLTKKEYQRRCGWDGNNYVYYQVNFKMSSDLKEELNKQLARKYK